MPTSLLRITLPRSILHQLMQRTSASTRSFSEKKKKSNDPTGEHSVLRVSVRKRKEKYLKRIPRICPLSQLNESALFNRREHRI